MTQNELIVAIAAGMILNNLVGLVISEIREKLYQKQSKKRLEKLYESAQRVTNFLDFDYSDEPPAVRPSAAKKAVKRTPKKDAAK